MHVPTRGGKAKALPYGLIKNKSVEGLIKCLGISMCVVGREAFADTGFELNLIFWTANASPLRAVTKKWLP